MARMKATAIKSKDILLRDTHWPEAEDRMWDRSRMDGYATVPKTLPLLMRAMDELSKGKPIGATYFALWCATWDNGFVRLGRATELPYASGFTGARGVRIWQERMKILESYGFVELRPSGEHKLGLPLIITSRWSADASSSDASDNGRLACELWTSSRVPMDGKLPSRVSTTRNA